MWISCDKKPFCTGSNLIETEAFMSCRVLTYTPDIGYRMSIWYKTFDLSWNSWIDSDDSMGPFNIQPMYWMSIDSIDSEWIDSTKLPKSNGIYLVWYPKLRKDTQFVLFYFKNGIWYDADQTHPVQEDCIPVLWMQPPAPPTI